MDIQIQTAALKAIQQERYDFCFDKNKSSSLTMTKKPKIIHEYLYKLATYVWIAADITQLNRQPQQIGQMAEVKINFVNSVQEIKEQHQQEQNIVIICHISLIYDIESGLETMFSSYKISCLIFYGINQKNFNLSFKYDVNTSYVQKQQQAIQQIKQDKKYYARGHFINFVSLSHQKWDSNILVKTMFAMIKQETSVQQIMEKFKQLAFLCGFSNHVFQFISSYQQKDHLERMQALTWYTRQTFLYHLVNRILRICKDPTCLYIIQPYFKDLFNAIKIAYQKQKKRRDQSSSKKFIYYRGGQISNAQTKFFQQNKNSFVQNLGFMSTSTNQNVARNFIRNALFEIQVDNAKRNPEIDYGFANISEFGEDQVLFNPLNSFKVVDFSFYDSSKNIYKIKLKYGEMARLMSMQDKNLTQEQLKYKWFGQNQIMQNNRCLEMGDVLIQETYTLQGCQKYCDKIVQIAKGSQDLDFIIYAHFLKGTMMKSKRSFKGMEKQFKICIQQLQKKAEIYKNEKWVFQKISNMVNNLGLYFNQINQDQQALKYFRKSIKIYRQNFGENHPDYEMILCNLGQSFNKIGRYTQAIKCFRKCQKIISKTLGKNNSNYARILNNLGTCFHSQCKYGVSIGYFEKALKINTQLLGDCHPSCARNLSNLATSYIRQGQYELAMECLQRCQIIQRRLFGGNHLDYARTINNLGVTLNQMEKYELGLICFKKCLKIKKQFYGQKHPIYAENLKNLSHTYQCLGQYKKQLQCLQKCEEIYRQNNKTGQYSDTLNSLGIFFLKMCYYKYSQRYFKNSLKILQEIHLKDHQYYINAIDVLTQLYIQTCQIDKAQFYAAKCHNSQDKLKQILHIKLKMSQIQSHNIEQMQKASFIFYKNVNNYIKKKQYQKAFEILQLRSSLIKNIHNSHKNIMATKVNLLIEDCFLIISKQIDDMYKLAHEFQCQGMYNQAYQIYSVYILRKYKYFWKYFPQIMSIVESDLEIIRQELNQEQKKVGNPVLLTNKLKKTNKLRNIDQGLNQNSIFLDFVVL